MSVWISATLSERLYTRTSSIRPENHSAQIALPPIRSGPPDVVINPGASVLATWKPFTYRRSVVAS
jgi:hypothetical protein